MFDFFFSFYYSSKVVTSSVPKEVSEYKAYLKALI